MVPHILLEEIGADFELLPVDTAVGAHRRPEYLRLNPNGLIPVLEDRDCVLYETAAIVLHLCDTHPLAMLAPPLATPERAQFYKWLTWLSNTFHAALIVYFYPERWMDAGNAAGAAELKRHAEQKASRCLEQLDHELARHGGPWFMGASYTALDAYVFTLCRWTRNFRNEPPARARPLLGPYLQRMLERAAVRRVLETEQIVTPYV